MKKKLFWILYFGVAIGANILAAVLLPEYIVFKWYSLFPIIFFILCAFLAWITIPGKEITPNSWYQLKKTIVRLRYDRQVGFYEEAEKERDPIIQIALEKSYRIIHVGLLIILPFLFMCIFLFPYYVKFLTCSIPLVILEVITWFSDLMTYRKHNRQNAKKLQQEREEQERREELGRWK